MTETNLTDKVIYVKNLQRASKVSYNSRYGVLELEVYKQRGGSIFYVKIDGVDKGVNRVYASDAWKWISEYIGVEVLQEVKPDKVVKKAGQSKWK